MINFNISATDAHHDILLYRKCVRNEISNESISALSKKCRLKCPNYTIYKTVLLTEKFAYLLYRSCKFSIYNAACAVFYVIDHSLSNGIR